MDRKDTDRLVEAFEHMVENVGEALHDAEEALAPTIDEMVHNAQQIARDLYALSQEEAESLGAALKRDLHKANQTLNQQGKELKDWLAFDLSLVEDRFIDLVARAADKAWLDFRAFENEDHQASTYSSGEVSTAGTFSCRRCDNSIRLTETGQIPTCPACGHNEFFRVII